MGRDDMERAQVEEEALHDANARMGPVYRLTRIRSANELLCTKEFTYRMPGLTQLGDLGRQSAGLRGPLAQSAPVRVALIAGIFLSVFRLRRQWKEEHGFCGV